MRQKLTTAKNTLHLNLKKQWFEMILSGVKKEEYRDFKEYWLKRFLYHIQGNDIGCFIYYEDYKGVISKLLSIGIIKWKHFDTIIFSSGYAKDRKQFEIELNHIRVGEGNEEWGAKKGTNYFALSLGKILQKNF